MGEEYDEYGRVKKDTRIFCDLCGEVIEDWEIEDGIAFQYDEGALHEKCREEFFGAR